MGEQNVMSLQVWNMKMYCLSFCFYCFRANVYGCASGQAESCSLTS